MAFPPLVPMHIGLPRAGYEEAQECVLTRFLITKRQEQGHIKIGNYFLLPQATSTWSLSL